MNLECLESTYLFLSNAITAIVGILIGGFISYRFGIGRDKRKEWRNLIAPIYVELRKELKICEEQGSAHFRMTDTDIFNIERTISNFRLRGFRKAVENYKESKSKNNQFTDDYGECFDKFPEKRIKAIKAVLNYLR